MTKRLHKYMSTRFIKYFPFNVDVWDNLIYIRNCSLPFYLSDPEVPHKSEMFARKNGGNLIEFNDAIRHAVRHLDSVYARLRKIALSIHTYTRVVRPRRPCTHKSHALVLCFTKFSLSVCWKTSLVLRSNVPVHNGLIWQIYDNATYRCASFIPY